jgi:hypothetical protein
VGLCVKEIGEKEREGEREREKENWMMDNTMVGW